MGLWRPNGGHARSLGVVLIGCLLVGSFGCSQRDEGRIAGRMFVPPGLRGNAEWGDVWLVRDFTLVRGELTSHEHLLTPALLSKDADFLRQEQLTIRDLGVIRAKLDALNKGVIPVQVVLPPPISIISMTSFDAIVAGIKVDGRPVSGTSDDEQVATLRRALKDSALTIRDRLQPAIERLMASRADQKRLLLADAEGFISEHRVMDTTVGMDGEFNLDRIPPGDYGVYGRYNLQHWYVLVSARVVPGTEIHKDLPRLPGMIFESKALMNLEALVMQIQRM